MSHYESFRECLMRPSSSRSASDDFEFETEDDYYFQSSRTTEMSDDDDSVHRLRHKDRRHNEHMDFGIEFKEYRRENHLMSTISREHIMFWANKLGMDPDELNDLANPKLMSSSEKYRKVKSVNPAMRKHKRRYADMLPLLELFLKAYNDPETRPLFDAIIPESQENTREPERQVKQRKPNISKTEKKMLRIMDEICKMIGFQAGLEREYAEREWGDPERSDSRQPGGLNNNNNNAVPVTSAPQAGVCNCNERLQSPQVGYTWPQFANEQQQPQQAVPQTPQTMQLPQQAQQAVPQMQQTMQPPQQFCQPIPNENVYRSDTTPGQQQNQINQGAAQPNDQNCTAPKTESKRVPLCFESVTDYALEYDADFIKEEAQAVQITHLDENNGIVKASSHSCNTSRRAKPVDATVDKDNSSKKPPTSAKVPAQAPPTKQGPKLPNQDCTQNLESQVNAKKSKLDCYKQLAQQQHQKLEYVQCQIEELKQMQARCFARNAPAPQPQPKRTAENKTCPALQGKPCVSFQLPPTIHNLPSPNSPAFCSDARKASGDRVATEKKEQQQKQQSQDKKPAKMPASCLLSKQPTQAKFNFKSSPNADKQTQQADKAVMQNDLQKMLQDAMKRFSKYAPSNIIDQKSKKN